VAWYGKGKLMQRVAPDEMAERLALFARLVEELGG
jgi:hypothetical protein